MKTLIIRSIQSDLLSALINSIHETTKEENIYMLDNLKQENFSKNQNSIKNLFWTKKKGDYSIFNISLKTIKIIRNENFDRVIIPHKQYEIDGFDNVILLCYLLQIKKWYHCSIDWKLRRVSKLYLVDYVINYILTVPLFIVLLPVSLLCFGYLFLSEKVLMQQPLNKNLWKCPRNDVIG